MHLFLPILCLVKRHGAINSEYVNIFPCTCPASMDIVFSAGERGHESNKHGLGASAGSGGYRVWKSPEVVTLGRQKPT